MSEKRLLDAVGGVSTKYILEAEPRKLAPADKERRKIKMFGKTFSVPAAAAIIAGALTLTAAAAYMGITFIGKSRLSENEEIISELKNDIFTDENEDMKITVEEFITDGSDSFLTVRYDFYTESGREWSEEALDFTKLRNSGNLTTEPALTSNEEYASAGWTPFTLELKERSSDKSRYFALNLRADLSLTDNPAVVLKYKIGGEPKTAVISTENTIKKNWYRLESTEQASEYFTPKYMYVTGLSCAVYGENNGYSESGVNGDGSTWCRVLLPTSESMELCTKLGRVTFISGDKKTDVLTVNSLSDLYYPVKDCDMTIFTAYQAGLDPTDSSITYSDIEPDKLDGIEICGVYYTLTKIEAPVPN